MLINMNNLLITLGDSWTEGVGCYPEFILEKYGNPPHFSKGSEQDHKYTLTHFRENTWAVHLAKKMEYDLVNLAIGGCANSTMAKKFNEFLKTFERNKYNKVLVIFLLSDPYRFSFYSNNQPASFNPMYNHNIPQGVLNFNKYYLMDLVKEDKDAWQETAFYIDCVNYMCDKHAMDLYFGSAFFTSKILVQYVTTPKMFFKDLPNCSVSSILDSDLEMSKCYHPNHEGYKKISDKIYDELKSTGYIV